MGQRNITYIFNLEGIYLSLQIFILVAFVILLGFGIMGTVRVKNGLDLTDVVPRETREYKFLEAQSKYFAFYNFYAITKVRNFLVMYSP